MIDKDQPPAMTHRSDEPQYVYPSDVVKVVDGDTIDVDFSLGDMEIDLGLGIAVRLPETRLKNQRLRLYGINAPETNRKEQRADGLKAKEWMTRVLEGNHNYVVIRTFKDATGKYGRWLALVFLDHMKIDQYVWENSLNKRMVDEGFASIAEY